MSFLNNIEKKWINYMVNHYPDVENKLKKQIKFSVVNRNYTSTFLSNKSFDVIYYIDKE